MNCDTLSERAAIARCALSTVTMAQFSNYSNLAVVVYFKSYRRCVIIYERVRVTLNFVKDV